MYKDAIYNRIINIKMRYTSINVMGEVTLDYFYDEYLDKEISSTIILEMSSILGVCNNNLFSLFIEDLYNHGFLLDFNNTHFDSVEVGLKLEYINL